ncbi:uncharacterized protein LOC119402724 [Rhipicephalus sanguineus]|uniref:uncharacterized protein LOC119402724 n=1 Tax=Rhipicephalus sanguineus TaxID=34632 RepID=UPI001893366F|nr:uncharacterized protein LOC119402724 [Rhipicephalus sanguineus]
MLRVGEGVNVEAYVLYDSTVNSQGLSQRNDNQEKNDPAMKNFTMLFQLVQQHFHNKGVMVTFEVKSAGQNDTLAVKMGGGALNATETLKNLIKYATEQSPRNNSIFYYFSEKELLEKTKEGDKIDVDHDDVGTFGTFCSKDSSAAVVKYYPQGETRHISTVEATARM